MKKHLGLIAVAALLMSAGQVNASALASVNASFEGMGEQVETLRPRPPYGSGHGCNQTGKRQGFPQCASPN